jgi:hypothetical protein
MTIWSEPLAGTDLQALLVAVRGSPIVICPIVRPTSVTTEWSAVRKSENADAFVLAWIASHVRDGRRVLM